MSVNGYERAMYSDISRAADSLENIANVLEAIRWELRQQREQRERFAKAAKETLCGF